MKSSKKHAWGKLRISVAVAVDDEVKARIDRVKAGDRRREFNEKAREALYALAQDLEDGEKG